MSVSVSLSVSFSCWVGSKSWYCLLLRLGAVPLRLAVQMCSMPLDRLVWTSIVAQMTLLGCWCVFVNLVTRSTMTSTLTMVQGSAVVHRACQREAHCRLST